MDSAIGVHVVVRIHGGIVLDSCRMLHIERGLDAVIERFYGMVWKDRIEGFYRFTTN
jgi:hypothetical protein